MNRKTSGMTLGQLIFFLLMTIVASILFVVLVSWEPDTASIAPESQDVAVCRDFLAGKPIPRDVFTKTFETGIGTPNIPKIERIAEEVGAPFPDLLKLVGRANQVVIFVGPKEDVPEKLRLAAQPAEAPLQSESFVPE
ncbi:MAG TPA: hypothetical protein VLH35_08895 [Candidatus Acidoferrales bacterium]|nr:hypothetical protein [Candidatus Acidoferrales bacterium]